MDMLLITTSPSDKLFCRINIDGFERPWTPKIRGYIVLFLQSSAAPRASRVNCDEMAGDNRLRQFANRNCYRFSRISRALVRVTLFVELRVWNFECLFDCMCAYVHLSFGVCALCLCSQNNNRDILSSIYFRLDYRMPDQVRPTMSAGQFLTDLNRFPVVNPYSERPVFAVRSFTFFRRLAAASFCFNDIGPFSGALVTCRQNFIIPSDFSLLYCMSPFCISEPVFVSQKNTNLVKIIQKDERIIAAVQFEIKLLYFFTSLNSSLIIFLRTYTLNCRNALDRLLVHMNIILLHVKYSAGFHHDCLLHKFTFWILISTCIFYDENVVAALVISDGDDDMLHC